MTPRIKYDLRFVNDKKRFYIVGGITMTHGSHIIYGL